MMNGYFDNAATSYLKPNGMYQHMADYALHYGANIGRGVYETAIYSGKMVAETRSRLLSLMDAPENKTVIFTPSATIALNTILFGVKLRSGDIVYVSHFEHNAVLRPLYCLQKSIDIQIKYLPMKGTSKYEFDLEQIKSCVSKDKPKLVILSHVSNVLGLISPVDEIALLAKKEGATIVVDGAQSCGLLTCNLHNIDYYVFAGHKTLLGPTGIGGFICNNNISLTPLVYGGTGIDSINYDMPMSLPERFEAGTLNLMAIAGLNYSIKWIDDNNSYVKEMERKNLDKLYTVLDNYPLFKIVSPYPNSSSIVSCMVEGYTSDEIGMVLAERGIAVRSGLHCAPKAHEYIGSSPEGLIRFSITCLTTDNDFRLLDSVLKELSKEII